MKSILKEKVDNIFTLFAFEKYIITSHFDFNKLEIFDTIR